MTDSVLHFTKRELQRLSRNRTVWIAVAATGLVLGLAGPFGTDATMRTLPRVAYWVAVVAFGFFGGTGMATLVVGLVAPRFGQMVGVTLSALAGGSFVLSGLFLLNWAALGQSPADQDYAVSIAANVLAVSLVVSWAFALIGRRPTPAPLVAAGTETPRIVRRLPLDRRGRLIALSVQDHYVEVITSGGKDLLLMRLADAIAETDPEQGLQVHRSHWVALAAVRGARRDGARVILTMSDGRDIPVSRTYLPAIKEAGLLPG